MSIKVSTQSWRPLLKKLLIFLKGKAKEILNLRPSEFAVGYTTNQAIKNLLASQATRQVHRRQI